MPEVSDLSKSSATMGKFLSDTQYVFTLEPYDNGTPAPSVVTKEVDMTVSALFLLINLTFQKQRWSRHTFTPLLLLLWITGKRQSKSRKGLSWGEISFTYFQPVAYLGQQDLGV